MAGAAIGAALAMGVASAGPAHAQDNGAIDKARDQFRQAIAAEAAGNWGAALGLLRQVANVKMTPQVRYTIALCEDNLGQLVAALGDYELALADGQAIAATDVTDVVPARIEALRARIPKLVVTRTERARTATVTVDGVQLGTAMLGQQTPVDPGTHVIEATAKGFAPFSRSVDIAEKESKTVEVDMTPMPVTAAPVATASGGAASHPAGADQGAAPEHKTNIVPFVVGGVGVASLAAAGVFYALRAGTMSDLDAVCGDSRTKCPKQSEDTYNRGKTYNTLTNVTLGLGVAALGTGAVLYFTSSGRSEPQAARVGIAPAAADADLGASFVGRF